MPRKAQSPVTSDQDFPPHYSLCYMDAIRVAKVEDVLCSKSGTTDHGTLHLTAHHLIFRYDQGKEEMWVPYPLVSLVTRLPQTINGSSPLTFRTRTFETFTLSFKSEKDVMDVFESVKELTVANSINQLYAFFYSPNPPLTAKNGWSLYSPREEFGRMGVGARSKAWRFTDINKDYSFSPTYPARLVVPTRISDTTLQYASKYRSKCRIPALTYLHWANFGSITRSSQPMVGLTNNRSIQDEKLIEAIFQTHHSPDSRVPAGPVYGATTTNMIIDARPTANAVANTAKGAGTENMDHYKDAKKAYLGIDHIHTMRESLAKVIEALRETEIAMASAGGSVPGESLAMPVLDRQALRRSGWLRHLSAIMEGALLIVRNIHINSSHVLIHCSDGWDRTAQLSALSQICLDPFYRTIRGFQILVEKDWLSFGHKFLDRCGHLSSEKFFVTPVELANNASGAEAAQAFFASVQNRFGSQSHIKETSPVFHQFLESVRQAQRQFPERFEFNERFLRQLYYHLYSCQFGTFLCNNERERRVGEGGPPVCDVTVSVWDFFNSAPEDELNINPDYDPSLDNPTNRGSRSDMGVLMVRPKDVRFWHELYGRTDEEMNGKFMAKQAVESSDVVVPVDGAENDPAILSGPSSVPLPPSPAMTPVPSPAASATLSKATPQGSESPAPDISLDGGSGDADPPLGPRERARQDSVGPFDSGGALATAMGFFSNQVSGPSQPSVPPQPRASPSPRPPSTQPVAADFFAAGAGGVRSMWGKLSSAVQDAAKDFKGLSLGAGNAPSQSERGGEMKSREEITAWPTSGSRPSSPTHRDSAISYTIGRATNPWSGNPSRPNLPSVFMDNPWNTARSASPDLLRETPVPTHRQASLSSGNQISTLPRATATPSESHSHLPATLGPLSPDRVATSSPASTLSASQWVPTGRTSQAQTEPGSQSPRPPPTQSSDPLGVGFL